MEDKGPLTRLKVGRIRTIPFWLTNHLFLLYIYIYTHTLLILPLLVYISAANTKKKCAELNGPFKIIHSERETGRTYL